jgi:hypothetical protein
MVSLFEIENAFDVFVVRPSKTFSSALDIVSFDVILHKDLCLGSITIAFQVLKSHQTLRRRKCVFQIHIQKPINFATNVKYTEKQISGTMSIALHSTLSS